MRQWIVGCGLVAAGCGFGEAARRAPTTVECAEVGTLRTIGPTIALDDRVAPETQVLQCIDESGRPVGPHLERFADTGHVAAEGQWEQGLRHGTWTVWREDGAFVRQTTYDGGVAVGEWLEVTKDGRVTAVTFDAGVVVGLRSLPLDAEMPEWTEGRETRGRRYQSGGS